MRTLLPGCRDGCCSDGSCVHPAIRRDQERCFWNKRAWRRDGILPQVSDVRLPSMRAPRLTVCCLKFLAQRCANTIPLPDGRTRTLFLRHRDGCFGLHRGDRGQARCFSHNLWSPDGSRPSRHWDRLAACCLKFLGRRFAYTILLRVGRTQFAFQGYRDESCGPHRGDRELARWFWNNRVLRRTGNLLQASAVNLSSSQDSPYQACGRMFPLPTGRKPVFQKQRTGRLPGGQQGRTHRSLHGCFSHQA